MENGFVVAIVGATGAVGKELLSVLDQRKFPVRELIPFASAKSEDRLVKLGDKSYRCQTLKKGCFKGVQIAFFDASDAVSKEWVPEATEAGAWVVDNSSTYRMEEDVPLLVPEVNGHLLEDRCRSGRKLEPRARILAGPNCSTVQMVVALKPLHERAGLKRVVVSTYQSTSGAGAAAMEELSIQTVGLFNQRSVTPRVFPHQIAFNCIPQIGGFKDDGYTGEEQKIMAETRKILGLPALKITTTAVRVPTFSCHGESINAEFERPITPEEAREALSSQPGIKVLDDPKKSIYPLGVSSEGDAVEGGTGRDSVYVGRIRKDSSVDNGLNLWVVSDNLRKGAALNAVQIGEVLVQSLR
jgi:aspartate-semialdehyde dehydrogenase